MAKKMIFKSCEWLSSRYDSPKRRTLWKHLNLVLEGFTCLMFEYWLHPVSCNFTSKRMRSACCELRLRRGEAGKPSRFFSQKSNLSWNWLLIQMVGFQDTFLLRLKWTAKLVRVWYAVYYTIYLPPGRLCAQIILTPNYVHRVKKVMVTFPSSPIISLTLCATHLKCHILLLSKQIFYILGHLLMSLIFWIRIPFFKFKKILQSGFRKYLRKIFSDISGSTSRCKSVEIKKCALLKFG